MEIPVLNRITELGGLSSSPDVNFLSRILGSFPGFLKFSPSQHFWKWSAVFLALLATFSGLIIRVKILIVTFRRKSSLVERENGASISDNLRSSPELEDDDEPPSSSGNRKPDDDESDFHVKGSGRFLRRRHRVGEIDRDLLPYLSSNRSVVKQWDNVRLKSDFDEFNGSSISLYDSNKEQKICSIFSGETPVTAASLSPPTMVLAAGNGVSGNVSLELWDTRVGSRIPAVLAEWNSPSGKIVDVYSGDLEKVYLRDNSLARVMVGDVRKVRSALENSTASGGVSW